MNEVNFIGRVIYAQLKYPSLYPLKSKIDIKRTKSKLIKQKVVAFIVLETIFKYRNKIGF